MKRIWLKRCFLNIEYNNSHKYPSKLCGFLVLFELTRFVILWSQQFLFFLCYCSFMPLFMWFLCTHCQLMNRLSMDLNPGYCHCNLPHFLKGLPVPGTFLLFFWRITVVCLCMFWFFCAHFSCFENLTFEPSSLLLKSYLPHQFFPNCSCMPLCVWFLCTHCRLPNCLIGDSKPGHCP